MKETGFINMKTETMPEVLAPAGNLTALYTAVDYGADAVYVGGQEFGMRAAPDNFTMEQLASGVQYAHTRRVPVYLTLNTLPRNDEVDRLPDFIRQAAQAGVDAFIVTDPGVLALVKRCAPDCQLHISVQAGIVNYAAARFYHDLGASRIVVARELSIEEIAEIRAKTPATLEIEAFVHGAMCMSVSGRCLLSEYLTGRDANRGDCAQPCRWEYALVEQTRPGQYMPIVQDDRGSYILNARDLRMIDHLDKFYTAGVTSFKIEGRAKTAYYVAAVTYAYKQAVKLLRGGGEYRLPAQIRDEVEKISHRAYSTGFYFGRQDAVQEYASSGYIRPYEWIAVVEDYQDGIATVTQRNRFYPGTYDVLDPVRGSFKIVVDQLYDQDMQPIECARHAAQIVRFRSEPLRRGAFIRARKSE